MESDQALVRKLEDDLVERFGLVLSSSALVKALGYPSADAFQMALTRNTFPVPVFQIAGRRGHFSLVCDVANYLVQQRRAGQAAALRADELPAPPAAARKPHTTSPSKSSNPVGSVV
jgi:hypothetical protein